jgi:hypothetical protein
VQLSIGGIEDPQVAADKARALAALEDLRLAIAAAVRLITPKELCFRLGIGQPYLSEITSGKKRFPLEWLPTVLLMAPIDAVGPILVALADVRGFKVERKKQMTEGEELRATRDVLGRLAPGVLALIDKEIGK